MSKIDQAFVKAFARRQTADVNQSETDVEIPVAVKNVKRAARPSLRVDRSVADTTAVWVDPDQDAVLRSDRSHGTSPTRPLGLSPQDSGSSTTTLNDGVEAIETDRFDSESAVDDQKPVVNDAYAIASFTTDVGVDSLDLAESLVNNLMHLRPPTPGVESGEVLIASAADESITDQAESEPQVDEAVADPDPPEQTSAATTIQPFRPEWEVDAFEIPPIIANLFFDEETFETIGRRMAKVVADGMQTAVLTSVNSGEGRSTAALGIALAAAASGIRVLLVDADIAHPTLADSLRIDAVTDWMDQILAQQPVEEAAIVSANDRLTLLPLTASDTPEQAAEPLGELLAIVQPHFDLILLDAGCGDEALESLPAGLDAAMLVHDAAITTAAEVNRFARSLSRHGFHTVGVIENFAGKNVDGVSDATKLDSSDKSGEREIQDV